MKGKIRCALLAGALLSGAAHGHHGVANFDLNRDIELEGVVTRVEFINPHSWLYFDVTNDDGGTTAWRCEMRGGTVLRRSGWTEDMFRPGTPIRILGSPDRRDPTTCYLATAYFPDGSSVDRYGQLVRPSRPATAERPARLPSGVPNLNGDWAAEQRVMTDPRGQAGTLVPISVASELEPGEVPGGGEGFPGARGTSLSMADDPVDTYWNRRPSVMPLTDAGRAAIEGLDLSSTDNPRLRCEPTNILFDWVFEMDVNRIVQTEAEIKLLYGSMGIERTIRLDLDEHPESVEPSRAGHSIGRWEGDVLVVDTIGFLPGILSADGRVPHSDRLHVVERFSLDPSTFALTREYFAEDPLYFEGRYIGMDVVYPSDLPYSGPAPCEDRTYRDEPASADDEKPWWDFLIFWD